MYSTEESVSEVLKELLLLTAEGQMQKPETT